MFVIKQVFVLFPCLLVHVPICDSFLLNNIFGFAKPPPNVFISIPKDPVDFAIHRAMLTWPSMSSLLRLMRIIRLASLIKHLFFVTRWEYSHSYSVGEYHMLIELSP